MRRPAPRTLLVLALTVVAAVSSVGWYVASRPVHGARFDDCHFEAGRLLVLDYGFGGGDRVTTSVAESPDGYVVGLSTQSSGGDHVMIRLAGQVVHHGSVGPRPVYYTDGTRLPCPVTRR